MLRTPAANDNRNPLHLPVRNERSTKPAPATSNIHPSATTENIVVATAIPEAIKPRIVKNAPNAKYQPHFPASSANPPRKRSRARSEKLSLLIQTSLCVKPSILFD